MVIIILKATLQCKCISLPDSQKSFNYPQIKAQWLFSFPIILDRYCFFSFFHYKQRVQVSGFNSRKLRAQMNSVLPLPFHVLLQRKCLHVCAPEFFIFISFEKLIVTLMCACIVYRYSFCISIKANQLTRIYNNVLILMKKITVTTNLITKISIPSLSS